MHSIQLLTREEMKNVKAGGGQEGPCNPVLKCPNGEIASCYSNTYCYIENNETCNGYLNCSYGQHQFACWEIDPNCAPSPGEN